MRRHLAVIPAKAGISLISIKLVIVKVVKKGRRNFVLFFVLLVPSLCPLWLSLIIYGYAKFSTQRTQI